MSVSVGGGSDVSSESILKFFSCMEIASVVFILEDVALILCIPDLHPTNSHSEFATCRSCTSRINHEPRGGYFFCCEAFFCGLECTPYCRVPILRSRTHGRIIFFVKFSMSRNHSVLVLP